MSPDELELLGVLKLAEHACSTHKVLGKQDVDYEWLRIKQGLLGHLHLIDDEYHNITDMIREQGLGGESTISL